MKKGNNKSYKFYNHIYQDPYIIYLIILQVIYLTKNNLKIENKYIYIFVLNNKLIIFSFNSRGMMQQNDNKS